MDLRISSRVAGRGGVVEDENLRLFQQGACDAETLFLATADIRAALFDMGVVALRHLVDELIGTGQMTGVATVVERGLGIAPAQVVEDGTTEKDIVLEYHADGRTQGGEVIVLDITPSHEYFAFGGVVEAADETDEGGLARARAANDTDGLARGDAERHVEERRPTRALGGYSGCSGCSGFVVEAHAPEIHAAIGNLIDGLLWIYDVRLFLDDLADALGTGGTLREHHEDHRQHHQRLEDRHHIGEE